METIADVSTRIVEHGDVVAQDDGNRVTVSRRRFGGVRARLAPLFGVKPTFEIRLDALGSAAWRLMDGQRTVAEIRAELVRTHPREDDLTRRFSRYLGTMVSHQMVRLR